LTCSQNQEALYLAPFNDIILYKCLDTLKLLPSLRSRGIDRPHPGYREPHPWEPNLATTITKSLPTSKARCTTIDIHQLQTTLESLEENANIATFYTDGSVEQHSGKAGAAFLFEGYLHAQRLSDDTSILQAELFVIRAALTSALEQNVQYTSLQICCQHYKP